jgi:hypothetical protein
VGGLLSVNTPLITCQWLIMDVTDESLSNAENNGNDVNTPFTVITPTVPFEEIEAGYEMH